MVNLLDRIKANVAQTEPPKVTQVFEKKAEPVTATVVQPVLEPKIIKQNNPGTPLMGFTLDTLATELGVVLEKAMHKAGVNSVNAEVFGIFNDLGIVPKGFNRLTDEYSEKDFYVLKNSNRMTELFKSLVKALNSSSSEVISFPYLVETTLELPLKYIASKSEFEYKEIKTVGLYVTPKEVDSLNYKFISEIQFSKRNPEIDGSVDLLVMKVDREEWKAAPYRV